MHNEKNILEPIYISGALNTGTCTVIDNEQGDLTYSAGGHRNLH